MKGSRMAKTVHVCVDGSGAYTLEEVFQDRPDHRLAVVSECFSLGPLRDIHQPDRLAERAAWFNHMIKAAHRDRWAQDVEDDDDVADHWGLTDLAQAPDLDEIAMVWVGANANEQILLRAVCHAWPHSQLWISEVPLVTADFEGRTAVALCSPDKLRQAQARPLTQDERKALADEWLALLSQDHMLRLYLEGKLVSCDESFFDEALLTRCGPDFTRAIHVVGQVMGEAADYVSDGFLFYRLRTLIARGALEAENREAGLRGLWVRRP